MNYKALRAEVERLENENRWLHEHLDKMNAGAHKDLATFCEKLAEVPRNDGLAFDDALAIAKGCFDYGGGHRTDGTLGVFHHGIQTVVNALEAAKERGLADSQVAVLHRIGTVAER